MNNFSIIESILYVMGNNGCELSKLKTILDISIDDLRKTLLQLQMKYENNDDSGLSLKIFGEKCFLLTKKINHPIIEKLIPQKNKNQLTLSQLETLTIIAYNQPCLKSKIENIRKCDATLAIDKLLQFGLIENIGKANLPGQPFQYTVTQKFFELFGIKSIKDLPQIDDIKFDINDDSNFFDSSR